MAHREESIPTRDSDFDIWFENLNSTVAAKTGGSPPEWTHIPAEKVTALTGHWTDWHMAHTKTLAPHTSLDTAAKNRKDYDRSIADASRMIQLEPQNADHYLLRNAAYNEKGENDKAIADCDQILRFDSNSTAAYNNRGAAYYDKGEHDRAIADYNQALRLNIPETWTTRARSLWASFWGRRR
jgi:tetratricopeptide (TPR) repeat protein